MLDHALRYHEAGFSIIPIHSIVDDRCTCGSSSCGKPGKHPRVPWKEYQAKRASKEQIERWWREWPEANIGIVTGQISRMIVLDIDGEEGLRSLVDAGLPYEELPLTLASRTGGGGYHVFLRYPERGAIGTTVGILPKVDIRSDGAYVVVPPSLHVSGRHYEWIPGRSPDDVDPADFDFGLLTPGEGQGVEEPRSTRAWFEPLLGGVERGERNSAASRLAGRYFGQGLTEAEVQLMLGAWNVRNDPPLEEQELDRTIRSIRDKEHQDDAGSWELLEKVSSVLELKLSRVRRISGEPNQYILEFDKGTCQMDTTQLLRPTVFESIVADATGVIPRRGRTLSAKTNPTHKAMAQMIMKAAEKIDAGVEATGRGELIMMLREYITSQRVMPQAEEDGVPSGGGFLSDGRIWVGLGDVSQFIRRRWSIRQSTPQLAQRLKAFGMIKRTFRAEGSSRIVWGVEPRGIGLTLDEEGAIVVYEEGDDGG